MKDMPIGLFGLSFNHQMVKPGPQTVLDCMPTSRIHQLRLLSGIRKYFLDYVAKVGYVVDCIRKINVR